MPVRRVAQWSAHVLGQERRALGAALSFLSRVPVPGEFDGDDVARAAAWFPLVGAGLGCLSGLAARRGGPALGLVTMTLLTGALHLDALADAADSLGTTDRERALEIMRDSRIGSFGTAAIALDLLVRADALTRLDRDAPAAWAAAAAVARAVPVLLGAALPYARPGGGTGSAVSDPDPARVLASAAGAVALSLGIVDRPAAMRALLLGAAVTVGSGRFWHRRVGGVTGDVLGASLELTETLLLASWRR